METGAQLPPLIPSEQDDLLRKQDKHGSGGVCLIPVQLNQATQQRLPPLQEPQQTSGKFLCLAEENKGTGEVVVEGWGNNCTLSGGEGDIDCLHIVCVSYLPSNRQHLTNGM